MIPPGAPMPPPGMPPQGPQMAVGGPPGLPAPMQAPPMGGPPQGLPAQPPSNVVTIDAVMRLLRDNAHRRFRIDIEADSTIAGDESQEKQDRAELIAGLTKMVEAWGPIVMAKPALADLAGELMLFGVRSFRVGRSLETVIEETVEKMKEEAGQPRPPPQPSPDELIKAQTAQAKGQAEIAKAQIDAQTARIEAQAKIAQVQLQTRAAAADHQQSMIQGQQDAALAGQAARNEAASNMMKAEIEQARFQRSIEAANAPPKQPKGQS